MRPPDFWTDGGPASALLAPLGWAWAAGSALRGALSAPFSAGIPVVCVGNLVVGGAGKTPVALSVGRHLPGAHFLSTGYGGRVVGPLRVDPAKDSHQLVGDEPLLLSDVAPCWVAKDRVAGAQAAAANGAACLVLDDGFQDPSLVKDISLLVVDGQVGFGSRRCMPAGPLREPVGRGLKRTTAVVILGEDRHGVAEQVGELPVLRARVEPEPAAATLTGRPVVAFAGIGRPGKFFQTLERLGACLVERRAFADHHPYQAGELDDLLAQAKRHDALLLTTSKDFVRLPKALRAEVGVLRIIVAWEDEAALMRQLAAAGGNG
jgi:tetraacyldisaccharide 4'-kinase